MEVLHSLGALTNSRLEDVTVISGIIGISLVFGMLLAIDLLGGAVIAGGWIGLAVYAGSLDRAPALEALALALLAVAVVLEYLAARRLANPSGGSPASAAAPVDPSLRLVGLALLVGGVAQGYVSARWRADTFELNRGVAIAIIVAVLIGALGHRVASRFLWGSVHAGAVRGIVSVVVVCTSVAVGALVIFVPFAGFVLAALAVVVAIRQRRQAQRKYKGLRILS